MSLADVDTDPCDEILSRTADSLTIKTADGDVMTERRL